MIEQYLAAVNEQRALRRATAELRARAEIRRVSRQQADELIAAARTSELDPAAPDQLGNDGRVSSH